MNVIQVGRPEVSRYRNTSKFYIVLLLNNITLNIHIAKVDYLLII
jgi:hypothetical protein